MTIFIVYLPAMGKDVWPAESTQGDKWHKNLLKKPKGKKKNIKGWWGPSISQLTAMQAWGPELESS